MRWEDERYVRVYTRDTVTWKMLSWQARTVLLELFRKVDRAGIMDVGEHGVDGVCAILSLPAEVVTVGLEGLITKGCIQWTADNALFIPNFLEAQEAVSSDAQRKRDQRERDAARALLSQNVTLGHDTGQKVTRGHAESRAVTSGHSVPSLAVPSLAVLKEPVAPSANGVACVPNKPRKPKKEPTEEGKKLKADTDAVVREYQAQWIARYMPADGKPPAVSGPDFFSARAAVKNHGAEAVTGYVRLYLADDSAFFVRAAHPLRLFKADAYRVERIAGGPRAVLAPMSALPTSGRQKL